MDKEHVVQRETVTKLSQPLKTRETTTKNKEIMPFAATRMDLQIAILSEVNQTEKDKYHMLLLIYGI